MKSWFNTVGLILSAIIALSLSACSQISVKEDYDASADFSQYTQFAWLPQEKQVAPTAQEFKAKEPLIAKRIENAIKLEMTAKNLSMDSNTPNAFITYHVTTQTKYRSNSPSTSVGFGFGGSRSFGGLAFSNGGDILEYEEGKLVIDIMDLNGKLLWRGISSSLLNEQSSPEKTTQFVTEVVAKLLAQYPPKPKP